MNWPCLRSPTFARHEKARPHRNHLAMSISAPSTPRPHEVNHFLKHVRCDKLILNGDIIDGWQLRRRGSWKKAHTRFVRIVLKKMEKRGTEVIYLRGNHDDILAAFLPLQFESLQMTEDYIHEGVHGRYLVLHGDVFDSVTKNFVFLAHLGDRGYTPRRRSNRI
jgi:UDP-2,3-diacylglucosamine pyrophosphatase LpxH